MPTSCCGVEATEVAECEDGVLTLDAYVPAELFAEVPLAEVPLAEVLAEVLLVGVLAEVLLVEVLLAKVLLAGAPLAKALQSGCGTNFRFEVS